MAKLRRTLFIGLGGTGFSTILNVKKMFHETYGGIPPMIGFLGIDTDAPNMKEASVTALDGTKITLSQSEKLQITVDSPMAIYERGRTRKTFDWLPESNTYALTTLEKGAGQVRSNGRFAITVNENAVEAMITSKFNAVNNARVIDNPNYELLGAETEVHVVFSLGGGTGSGTFLNLAYMLQRVLPPKTRLSGYAVLPDVFRAMKPGAGTERVRPNGMGAIRDIDFLTHLNVNSLPVELKWLHQTDQVKTRPFTALYLIDNRNANNDSFSHIDDICQMISLALVSSVGQLGVTMDSIADNVDKIIADGAMDILDKKAWVAGFGCSEIIFNGDRPATIYAAKAAAQIVNMLLNGGCDDPANIANSWFDTTHIRENLGKDDVIDYFMSAAPQYTFQSVNDAKNPKPECTQYLDTRAVETPQALAEKLDQLEKRVDAALSKLMAEQANRQCGIFNCEAILHNILTQIELCDAEMKAEKEEYEAARPGLESRLDAACRDLADCENTIFKRGKKGYEEDVVDTVMALARNIRETVRRARAREFYAWLKVRVGESFGRLDTIIQNLKAARTSANERVQTELRKGGSTNFFQFDLSGELAEKVECPMSDIVFGDFITSIKDRGGVPAFAGMSSAETAEAIMEYVATLPAVSRFATMTIDDVLKNMSQSDVDSLIRRALQKALPLLPYDLRGFNADQITPAEENYYVGVADKTRSRIANVDYLKTLAPDAKEFTISEIGFRNRIIIYRQLGVLPAFTVKSLDNYAVEYERFEGSKPHTSHWSGQVCERMAKERYSLEPKTTNANTLDLWVKAIVFDLIEYDSARSQYTIASRGLGGKISYGFKVDMGATRAEANQFFVDNIDVLEDEVNARLMEMDIPGPENRLRPLRDRAVAAVRAGKYLAEVSKSPVALADLHLYPAEEALIEQESFYILDNY